METLIKVWSSLFVLSFMLLPNTFCQKMVFIKAFSELVLNFFGKCLQSLTTLRAALHDYRDLGISDHLFA